MGVATDENLRLIFFQQLIYPGVEVRWPATYVSHPYGQATAYQVNIFLKPGAKGEIINVAKDSLQRFMFFQFIDNFRITDIASMPYLIAVFEMLNDSWIEIAVSVR